MKLFNPSLSKLNYWPFLNDSAWKTVNVFYKLKSLYFAFILLYGILGINWGNNQLLTKYFPDLLNLIIPTQFLYQLTLE